MLKKQHILKQKGARVVKRHFSVGKTKKNANKPYTATGRPVATKQQRYFTTKIVKHRNPRAKMHKSTATAKTKISKKIENKSKSMELAQDITVIDSIVADGSFSEYVTKSIGKRTIDVIKQIAIPQEDEKIASTLSMKINDVRRILNMLNSYGVARYDIDRDNKGWLSFKWYINNNKLREFKDSIDMQKNATYKLPESCDDFFVCDRCFEKNKIVIPFDTAFESSFKCIDCGRPLRRVNKEEASSILSINNSNK